MHLKKFGADAMKTRELIEEKCNVFSGYTKLCKVPVNNIALLMP